MKKKIIFSLIFCLLLIVLSSCVFSIDNSTLHTLVNASYSFDTADESGTTIIDVATFRNNGTRGSGVTIGGTGIINQMGDWDDTNTAYIDMGTNPELQLSTDYDTCLLFWASIDDMGGAERLYDLDCSPNERSVYFNNGWTLRKGEYLIWNTAQVSATGWTHYAICTGLSGSTLWRNGTLENDLGTTASTTLGHFYLGNRYNGGTYDRPYDGRIDELHIFHNTLLSTGNINYIMDAELNGYSFQDDWLSSTTSNSSLITFQKNESGNIKTTFNEGENFYSFINWTRDDGTPINMSNNANCTMTLERGLFENETSLPQFSLCNHVICDYSTIKENFFLEETTNAINDSVRIYACHNNRQSGNILINISCGGNYTDFEAISGLFPRCDDGFGVGVFETDVCTTFNNLNVTLTYLGNQNTRKTIDSYEVDREFSQHEMNNDEFSFNSTSGLWESTSSHEYYNHGAYWINTTCDASGTDYDNSYNTTITIVNIPPRIVFGEVLTSQGSYNIVSGEIIEFGYGNFTFQGAIIDDDMDLLNLTFYNSTDLILSYETRDIITLFNISSDLFRDLGQNPFNLSVWVNDTYGASTNDSILFNVSDTIKPVCTGLNSREQLNNTNLTFNISCTDDSFFSFNLTCSNGVSNVSIGMNVPQFDYYNIFLLDSSLVCSYKYCDGHTAEELSLYFIDELKDKTVTTKILEKENTITPITDFDNVKVSTELLRDRITFKYEYPEPTIKPKIPVRKTFHYTTSLNSYYLPSEKYKGWIVDYEAGTWFDANLKNDEDSTVIVKRINSTTWIIDVYSLYSILEFESIGELNCVEGSFLVEAVTTYSPASDETELVIGQCPRNIPTVLLYLGLLTLGAFLITMGFKSNLLGFFGGIFWIILSLFMVSCNTMLGYALLGVSLLIVVYFAIKN